MAATRASASANPLAAVRKHMVAAGAPQSIGAIWEGVKSVEAFAGHSKTYLRTKILPELEARNEIAKAVLHPTHHHAHEADTVGTRFRFRLNLNQRTRRLIARDTTESAPAPADR